MDVANVMNRRQVCDFCGYDLRGLNAQTPCPECGSRRGGEKVSLSPALSATQKSWSRHVLAGVILLMLAWVMALRVTLIMRVGNMSAINMPGPKLVVASMVEYPIGGPPGPYGVMGMLAPFVGCFGLWLITQPQTERNQFEHIFSLRRCLRWIGLALPGAFMGATLSRAPYYISPHGDDTAACVSIAVLACELPVNAMLFAYLLGISRKLHDRVGIRLGKMALVMVIGLLAVGGTISAVQAFTKLPMQAIENKPWLGVGLASYGAAAMIGGAISFAMTLRLIAMMGMLAWPARRKIDLLYWIGEAKNRLRTLSPEVKRYGAMLGIGLWIVMTPVSIMYALKMPWRQGLGGNLPYINFPGPKISLIPLAESVKYQYGFSGTLEECFRAWGMNILAVWLMTMWSPDGKIRWLAKIARWTAVALTGATLGLALAMSQSPAQFMTSKVAAVVMVFAECPATLLVYLHLSQLARRLSLGRLSAILRWQGVLSCSFAVLVTYGYLMSKTLPGGSKYSKTTAVVCAIYMMLVVLLTFWIVKTLGKLAWEIWRRSDRGMVIESADEQMRIRIEVRGA